jgi:thiosulfate reductase cytochrome b subunit
MQESTKTRKPQPLPIRLMHWISSALLFVMAGSGLQILAAYPYLGPRGQTYAWYPFQGVVPPSFTRLGGWLAGARDIHFAFAWFLIANGAGYVAYIIASGEWRRRVFLPRRDLQNSIQTALFYLRLRKDAPSQGFYNGLQRAGYTGAVLLGVLEVLSGIAMWKPVQFQSLALLFGGYDGARAVHFLGLVALGGFFLGHVLMVVLHPRTLITMITGGKNHE